MHVIFIGDSVMRLVRYFFLKLIGDSRGFKVTYIETNGGIHATMCNITSTLADIRRSKETAMGKSAILFNSGLHNINILCSSKRSANSEQHERDGGGNFVSGRVSRGCDRPGARIGRISGGFEGIAFAAAIATTTKTTNVVNGSRANGDVEYRNGYDGGCDNDGHSTGRMLDLLGRCQQMPRSSGCVFDILLPLHNILLKW